IGKLFARSSCLCIGEQDGLAIVLYKVKVGIPEAFKVGFVDAAPAALTPQPSNGPVSPAF
ncbi:MAG: hypothetical protein LBB75_02435, partial [Oscillospiraceae bacterium]|nr:hypothetical protein [Oscillospiraceae bacterium]